MSIWTEDIATKDNLWHSLVAVAFTVGFGAFLPYDFVFAGIAALGLYVREAIQADLDFTLRGSLHKHLEWIVGSVAAFIAAAILTLL